MFTKFFRLLFIFFLLSFNPILPDEFSEGPYGLNYFDIAESFSVSDLNVSLQGDVNLDETINIQDVILLIGQVLGNTSLNELQIEQADLNNDNVIDVLDIVNVVSKILYPQEPQWNLENNWTGNDSYIFIHFDANVGTSSALWGSNTREQLLSTSPDNVHYFFISNRAQYESDILQIKVRARWVITWPKPVLRPEQKLL